MKCCLICPHTTSSYIYICGFTLVIFCDYYSLLFGVSQGSVLKTVVLPIMVYFKKILSIGLRVVSLALIPHLLISIHVLWYSIFERITASCYYIHFVIHYLFTESWAKLNISMTFISVAHVCRSNVIFFKLDCVYL